MSDRNNLAKETLEQKLEQLEFILTAGFRALNENDTKSAEVGVSLALSLLLEIRGLVEQVFHENE